MPFCETHTQEISRVRLVGADKLCRVSRVRRRNPDPTWGLIYGAREETGSSDSRRDTADETRDYFSCERAETN